MIEKTMVSLDEAIEIILEHTPTLMAERVSLNETLGRVLAEAIHSRRDHPPWDNSAMDGFAVRWQNICTASPESPARLKIVGESQAGSLPQCDVNPGEAVQIMTGAPTPNGADTVVRIEDCRIDGNWVVITNPGKQGANIRRLGEDVRQGQDVLAANTSVRPAEVGMLATAAYSSALVYQQPRVSVLTTGDELTEPGEALTLEKIINSNAYSIAAVVRESGAYAIQLDSAKDNKAELEEKMRQALTADVALVVGGVSLGKYDYVKEVLETLGCAIKFWRIAVRPGHPVVFGIIDGDQNDGMPKLLFGLPGNPVSCLVAFYEFVRPALRKMMGHQELFLPKVEAILEQDTRNRPGRTHFARAVAEYRDGDYYVRLTPDQGSGILTSMTLANCLAILDLDRDFYAAGERITIQLLP